MFKWPNLSFRDEAWLRTSFSTHLCITRLISTPPPPLSLRLLVRTTLQRTNDVKKQNCYVNKSAPRTNLFHSLTFNLQDKARNWKGKCYGAFSTPVDCQAREKCHMQTAWIRIRRQVTQSLPDPSCLTPGQHFHKLWAIRSSTRVPLLITCLGKIMWLIGTNWGFPTQQDLLPFVYCCCLWWQGEVISQTLTSKPVNKAAV